MARSFWDDIPPPGTLEVNYKLVHAVTGGHRRGAEIYIVFRSGDLPRCKPPRPAFDKGVARGGDAIFAKFSYIRRPHVDRPVPPSVRAGKREILYAATFPERTLAKKAKAKRHGKLGVYTIRKELMTPALTKFVGPAAKARFLRIVNRHAAPPSAAARYQRYIDGPIAAPGSKSATRIEEVNGEPSLLGNIGTGRAERAKFWAVSVGRSRRSNARFQYRILLLLPASFTPEERRAAVEEFARRLFEPYGIRWSAAIHKSVPRSRTEDGVVHAHILFEPLGTDRMRELRKQGDRVYLQLGWPAVIKQKAADAFNEVYWRSERRIGLPKGTPVFGPAETVKTPDGMARPKENPNLWRIDEKREKVGLPTTAQRKTRLETGPESRWMAIDPFVAVLEKIPDLLSVLLPGKLPIDPTVEKALRYLRKWGERLIEAILDEMRQTHEVATYLSLPAGTKPSELLELVYERFRGVNWSRSRHRLDYMNGYDGLDDEKMREKGSKGAIAREFAETIAAIQKVEGVDFYELINHRRKLTAYHRLMVRALQGRQLALEALTDTIRYLEGLSPASLQQSANWWPYLSMAANGIGVVRRFSCNDHVVFVEERDLPRKAMVDAAGQWTFFEHRSEQDDPWLRTPSEHHVKRVQELWKDAIAKRRQMVAEIMRSMQMRPASRPNVAALPKQPSLPQFRTLNPSVPASKEALARPATGPAGRSGSISQQQHSTPRPQPISPSSGADQTVASSTASGADVNQRAGRSVAEAIASKNANAKRTRDERSH